MLVRRLCLIAVGFLCVLPAVAAERDPCAPRVPEDQLAQARALKPPIEPSRSVLADGKAIFEGKGGCFSCHGRGGRGDGPVGGGLTPSPRNFTNRRFVQCKTPGEMFWVVKHGIAGTAMIAVVATGAISEEEAWKAVLYERSLAQ